jgi:hypothetical protein
MEKLKAEAALKAASSGQSSSSALAESAKQFGASKAVNIGGKNIANPLNKLDEE